MGKKLLREKIEKEKKEKEKKKNYYEEIINKKENNLDRNTEILKKDFYEINTKLTQEKNDREENMERCKNEFKIKDCLKIELLMENDKNKEKIEKLKNEIDKLKYDIDKNEEELKERNNTIKQKIERI